MTDVIINDTTLTYIGPANWIDRPEGGFFTGEAIHNRWRGHIWETDGMPISEFDSLFALEGQQVRIFTTNYDDRNAATYKFYYNAILKNVVGRHDGPNMINVKADFLVLV